MGEGLQDEANAGIGFGRRKERFLYIKLGTQIKRELCTSITSSDRNDT